MEHDVSGNILKRKKLIPGIFQPSWDVMLDRRFRAKGVKWCTIKQYWLMMDINRLGFTPCLGDIRMTG